MFHVCKSSPTISEGITLTKEYQVVFLFLDSIQHGTKLYSGSCEPLAGKMSVKP